MIRLSTEYYLKKLFTINKYQVVSQAEPQNLNPIQKYITESLLSELNIFLTKKNLITKLIEEKGQEEIFSDELKKLIKKSGKQIERWSAYEAIIDGQKHFIRRGSKKPKGWQVTFRGRKPGSFIDSLYKGIGFLRFSRDGVPIIPLSKIQEVIDDDKVYNQDTIDIWIKFSEDDVFLSYRNHSIDITEFKLMK